jgi:tripartite ATP-independent transporter DctP family solute receptor
MDYGVKPMTVLNLPYIFRDIDHVWKTLDGPIGQELLDSIKGQSLKGMGYYPESPRHFFFKSKVVKSIADMKGLKLRVQPGQMYLEIVKAFGASPTPVAYSELYSALQTGVVDGAENPLVGYYANNFHEVAPYMTLDGHEASPSVILFSESQWNKLPKAAQDLVLSAWKESERFYKKLLTDTDADVTAKMRKTGVTITEVGDKQEWIDAVKPVYDKFGTGFESLIKRIQEIK